MERGKYRAKRRCKWLTDTDTDTDTDTNADTENNYP